MKPFHFPQIFVHNHSEVRNVNQILEEKKTLGQKAADKVATTVGSWKFIIIQSFFLILWVIINISAWIHHWDPYPFILMNLVLSLQAAFTAPVIMMSQNRQAERDRVDAHNDYLINLKAEKEIRAILDNLAEQNKALSEIYEKINSRQNN